MDKKEAVHLIKLGGDVKDFTSASGVKYTIESSISRKRWVFYLRESPKLAFGQTVEEIFNTFLEIYNITNEEGYRRGDIAVLSRDAMKGIEGIVNRDDQTIVRLCALFINAEDEDRRDITEDIISKKIQDWDETGIDMQSFFQFALAFIPNFKSLYEASLELTSLSRK
jgi:hypothetical protein